MSSLFNAYCRIYQSAFKIGTNFLSWKAPTVISGKDSVLKIPALLRDRYIKNVLLITDSTLLKLGLPEPLIKALEENNIKCTVFSDVKPNPTIDNVEEAVEVFGNENCQAIIAMGGGSAIDCAKAAGARISNPDKTISDMRGQIKVTKALPLLIAIPTTAGTGSETTVAAVIVDPESHEKYAMNDPKLRPKVAVLDPLLTKGLPPHITASTGMDALTHAVEAYIGRSNTEETEACARKAVKLIFGNLEKAYYDGGDLEARKNMLEASYYAGVAFTRAYVGYVHAIAHQLGGLYDLPHGLANAVILPYVLEWFGTSAHKRLAELSYFAGTLDENLSNSENAVKFISEIKEMNRKMNIPEKLDCIREEDIPLIAERALQEANPLYPVPKIMDTEDCMQLIRSMME